MTVKDPVWLYFVVPLSLLVFQVIVVVLYMLLKRVVLAKLTLLTKKEDDGFTLPTSKELQMQAEIHRQERIANNHKTLLKDSL